MLQYRLCFIAAVVGGEGTYFGGRNVWHIFFFKFHKITEVTGAVHSST